MTGLCECGCGEATKLATRTKAAKGHVRGEPLRFVHGHSGGFAARPKFKQFKLRSAPPVRFGRENNRFNGGLSSHPDGRALIVCRDGSHLAFARGLMAAHVGRLLASSEIVHHKNGDHTDDRIENLQIVTRAEHIEIHRVELEIARGIRAA